MICQTLMQLPLADVAAKSVDVLALPPKLKQAVIILLWVALEKRRAYHRQWDKANQDKTREYHLKKYAKRKEIIRAKRQTEEYKTRMANYLREYRKTHSEKIKALNRQWVSEHADWVKEYREANADRRRELYQIRRKEICARKRELAKTEPYRARVRNYSAVRRRGDIQFSLKDRLRASMNRAFRRSWVRKPKRTEALLGCSIAEAKAHIESQFVDGMSWENRESFVIDHYVPIAAFDLTDAEEVEAAFCWRNLRPITQAENSTKSAKLPAVFPYWLPAHIAERIRNRRVS